VFGPSPTIPLCKLIVILTDLNSVLILVNFLWNLLHLSRHLNPSPLVQLKIIKGATELAGAAEQVSVAAEQFSTTFTVQFFDSIIFVGVSLS